MHETEHRPQQAATGFASRLSRGFFVLTDKFLDAFEENFILMIREKDLFAGITLLILGALNFHSGKYCDGNAADYLSCTRPTTYYYYGWIEIIVILLGTYFILFWFLKHSHKRSRDL